MKKYFLCLTIFLASNFFGNTSRGETCEDQCSNERQKCDEATATAAKIDYSKICENEESDCLKECQAQKLYYKSERERCEGFCRAEKERCPALKKKSPSEPAPRTRQCARNYAK